MVDDQMQTPDTDGSLDLQAESAVPEAAVDAVDADDPNAELRALLESEPGEWYVVHSYAGYERRVKQNIEVARRNQDLEDEVFRVEVPMETVWEIKKGERKRVERVKLPGYVLVLMEHSPRSWTAIRNTPGVTGFVGHGDKPIPLSIDDVFEMLKAPERAVASGPEPKQQGKTAAKVVASEYHVGDVVEVSDGPFATLQATISEVNPEAQRVTAMVELFGRDTPVELRFDQITAV